MDQQLGTHLQELRRRRGLPVARLAAAANLGRSTVIRWESGQFRPRLVELNALLDALAATAAERRRALELLDAPRALRLVQQATSDTPNPIFQPRGGDLLRALRLRRGWSQARVAGCVGVAQTTLSRWEQSETWPTSSQLHALCDALGAREEEVTALTVGRFPLAGGNDPAENSVEAIWSQWRRVLSQIQSAAVGPMMDFYHLSLQARAFSHAQRNAAGRRLLGRIYVSYQCYLADQNRMAEVMQYAARTESLVDAEEMTMRLGCAIYSADALVAPVTEYGARAAVRLLRPWLSAPLCTANRSWLLHALALQYSFLNQPEDAIALGYQAYQMPGLAEEPYQQLMARRNLACLCAKNGRPAEALALVIENETQPWYQAYAVMTRGHAYLALNDRAEAHTCLGQLRELIETPGLDFFRDDRESLEAAL